MDASNSQYKPGDNLGLTTDRKKKLGAVMFSSK